MTLLVFFLILSILILVHEFGHFIVAKKAGVKVEEFALGFPPRIISKKIGETRYSVNALPIGGYVRLFGEDEPTETENHRSFFAQALPVKLAVALAGALMNLLLGIFAFTILYANIGIPTSQTNYPIIVAVSPDSPAQKSDLKALDRILKIGDREVKDDKDVKDAVAFYRGKQVQIEVDRTPLTLLPNLFVEKSAKLKVSVWATPRSDPKAGEGPLGIAIDTIPVTKTAFYPPVQMIIKATQRGLTDSMEFTRQILFGLSNMVRNLVVSGQVPGDVSGPVGIFQIVDVVAKTGWLPLLSLVGVLSINLAVVNALPFPGLDGARALFVIIHGATGRKMAPAIEKNIHLIGIIFLLLLILLISIRDVRRLLG
ncbi:MAG: site-2 protease family protein [Candidatus Blackburnbacteria bacterium]|nr:site-2 protease family protein [Candidatus Blackburnbacteria bacterium]